jgi:hypothetical protein
MRRATRLVTGAVRSFRHDSQRHAALTSVRGVGEHLDACNGGGIRTAAVTHVECPVDPSEPRAAPRADPQPADRGDLLCRLARPTRSPFSRLAFSARWPQAQPYVAHSRRRDCGSVDSFGVLPASRRRGSRGHGHDFSSWPWRVERAGCSRRYARAGTSRALELGVSPGPAIHDARVGAFFLWQSRTASGRASPQSRITRHLRGLRSPPRQRIRRIGVTEQRFKTQVLRRRSRRAPP